MANRTRFGDVGYIYFVGAFDRTLIKIGWTFDPERRLMTLECGSPVPLVLIGALRGTQEDEHAMHVHFRPQRVKGEWFRACPELVALAEAAEQKWNAPRTIMRRPNGDPPGPV